MLLNSFDNFLYLLTHIQISFSFFFVKIPEKLLYMTKFVSSKYPATGLTHRS